MSRIAVDVHRDGADWRSVHLHFTGDLYGSGCDRVILELAGPIIDECLSSNRIDRAFFVRYGDGGAHVRLRLRAIAGTSAGELHEVVERHLDSADRADIGRVEPRWIAYEPEYVRYGGRAAMPLAERMFHASSALARALVRTFEGDDRRRLGQALLAMLVQWHVMLDGNRARIASFAGWYRTSYLPVASRQSGVQGGTLASAFAEGFERQARILIPYVHEAIARLDADDGLSPAFDAFRAALRDARTDMAQLHRTGAFEAPTGPYPGLDACIGFVMPSQVHMTSNRIGVAIVTETYLAHLVESALSASARKADGVRDDRD